MSSRPLARSLVRLGAALLLALASLTLLVGLRPAPASAACVTTLPAVGMARADSVFTGTITAVTHTKNVGFTNTVAVDRVFKGSVPAAAVQVRTTGGECGLGGLTVGQRYVLMVSVAGDQLVAGPASGTAPATDQLMTRVTGVLGAGTAYGATAEPVPVAFTLVGDVEPTPLLRAAAPGLALALAGFLGWLLARRFAR